MTADKSADQARRQGARCPTRSRAAAQALNEGIRSHRQRRFERAAQAYQAALKAEPDNFDALHNLGLVRLAQGQAQEALRLLRKALNKKPGSAEGHYNLGVTLQELARHDEAVARYERALAIRPDYAKAHNNLGNALQALGRSEEALRHYERALALRPDHARTHYSLGKALQALGRHQEALALYEKALSLAPELVEAQNGLGVTLQALGRHEEALARYEAALALRPDYAEAHSNLGTTLRALGRHEEAIVRFERAIAINPDYADAYSNLGNALQALSRHEEAIACYERAISVSPVHARAHYNLGNALQALGRHEEAVAHYRKAVALEPDFPEAGSNLLFSLNHLAAATPETIFAAHRAWAASHAGAPESHDPCRDACADPERRLRIGYVSPDFCEHSVYYFMAPLLAAHDRRRVEITCYADVGLPDAFTARLMAHADQWLSIAGRDDATVAERIRRDAIDILVDLAGHTRNNRLRLFARKPAPVQMSWLGYPATTGLATIDYRITDAIADPEDGSDRFYSESLIRLPRCFVSFQPLDSAGPTAPLPAHDAGHLTFGSFNNISKVTPQVMRLWARLLHAVPGSRLLLKGRVLEGASARERLLSLFAEEGIERARIELAGWTASKLDHLALYGRVDIALDPFPYNGATTTCEALWMGVPVVTLRGDRHAGRVGASLLTAVALPELIAEDSGAYVATAAALAHDRGRLAALRAGLRERMRASPLCEAKDFACAMEAAYRAAWQRWCASSRAGGP